MIIFNFVAKLIEVIKHQSVMRNVYSKITRRTNINKVKRDRVKSEVRAKELHDKAEERF